MSKPPDRVKYTNLLPLKKDFEEIEALGFESGILQGTAHFEDYVDASFAKDENGIQAYAWEGKKTGEPSPASLQQPPETKAEGLK